MIAIKHRPSFFIASILYTVALSIGCFFLSPQTNAVGTCTFDDNTFSGTARLDQGTYAVYVRLEMSGEPTEEVTLMTSKGEADCQEIGTVAASNDEWVKAGEINADTSELQVSLTSSTLTPSYQFDRPSVLLVSTSAPACQPTTNCIVSVAGEDAALQLTPTEPDTGTLRLYIPKAINQQSITQVEYFADGTLMYKTDDFQAFSTQSIPFNTQVISRVITFSDGQKATIEEKLSAVHTDSLGAMLLRTLRKYQPALFWIAGLAALVVLYFIVRLIMHGYQRRQYWRYAHGFIKGRAVKPPKPTLTMRLYEMGPTQRITTGLGLIATIAIVGVGLVVLCDSFAVQISTVQDTSMQQSLNPGKKVVIDKTGVTFALMNQSHFIPERGQIVATQPSNATVQALDDQLVFRRVIGLPGERVVMDGDMLYVYNASNPDGFNPSLNTGWEAMVIPSQSNALIDIQLRNDEVFLLGDNRPGAIDSRQLGPLLLENIIGVVRFSL